MIEAMEQQIINGINNRWTKDKNKRKDIDIDKISECFRVICSSRTSILAIIKEIKERGYTEEKIDKLERRMNQIYKWVTEDCINNLIDRYRTELKDKKKEAKYIAEIPEIENSLQVLKKSIMKQTLEELLKFHKVKKEV